MNAIIYLSRNSRSIYPGTCRRIRSQFFKGRITMRATNHCGVRWKVLTMSQVLPLIAHLLPKGLRYEFGASKVFLSPGAIYPRYILFNCFSDAVQRSTISVGEDTKSSSIFCYSVTGQIFSSYSNGITTKTWKTNKQGLVTRLRQNNFLNFVNHTFS